MKKLTERQKQAISTELKITQVAMELFITNGYYSVKVQDICTAAEVSVGAFYHYFKSKSEIFNKGYMRVDAMLQEKVEAISSFDSTKDEILFILGEAGALLQELSWNFVAQAYKHLMFEHPKYTLQADRFVFLQLEKAIEAGIKKNELIASVNPSELTITLLRVSRGVIFDWCLHEGTYDLREKTKSDVYLILTNYLTV